MWRGTMPSLCLRHCAGPAKRLPALYKFTSFAVSKSPPFSSLDMLNVDVSEVFTSTCKDEDLKISTGVREKKKETRPQGPGAGTNHTGRNPAAKQPSGWKRKSQNDPEGGKPPRRAKLGRGQRKIQNHCKTVTKETKRTPRNTSCSGNPKIPNEGSPNKYTRRPNTQSGVTSV